MQRLKLGSLFSGIGGFELGLEDSIPGLETVWQVEQNKFCQRILSKHWPEAKIYDDVREINKNNVESVDVLCGGFPCQDISIAGKQRGVNEGEKSSLWWEMWRIISELRPQVIVLENVSAIVTNGGTDVISSLTQLGYDCGWCVIRSGADFGFPIYVPGGFVLPTPTATGTERKTRFAQGGRSLRCALIEMNLLPLPTPTVNESKNNPSTPSQWKRASSLNVEAAKLAGYTLETIGKNSQLNPQFVEEMMGFPIGWTE